jgi:RimJ/RimL family protein N-acetyltransferase
MNIIIETERLILREFTIDDYQAVFEFNSNVELHKYTGDKVIKSLESSKDMIRNIWIRDYKNYGFGRWAAIYKPENKIIGFAGLKYLPEFDEVDIGYRFLPYYWGKGIATEVSVEIIKYGFEKLGIEKIIGIARIENTGSCKVLEKIGLSLYKTGDYMGDKKRYNWYMIERSNYKTGFHSK